MDRTNYFFSSGIHESTPPASRVATHDADAEDARGSWDMDSSFCQESHDISSSLLTAMAQVSKSSSSGLSSALIPHSQGEMSLDCNPTGMAVKSVQHAFDGHNATYLDSKRLREVCGYMRQRGGVRVLRPTSGEWSRKRVIAEVDDEAKRPSEKVVIVGGEGPQVCNCNCNCNW